MKPDEPSLDELRKWVVKALLRSVGGEFYASIEECQAIADDPRAVTMSRGGEKGEGVYVNLTLVADEEDPN